MKKTIKQLKRIGILGNPEKPAFRTVIRQAVQHIEATGRIARCDVATARFASLKCKTSPSATQLAKEVDLLVVFGGDGTILRAARETANSNTPIIGINIGGLGFLTSASAKDLLGALELVWAGKYTLESRSLIEATGLAGGKKFHHLALNDFVVSRGTQPRLVELEVSVDGQPLTRYRADGLIISSPTGSTAYSLAAGGAIIVPTAKVFSLTPVCAHTLSNRSLVLDFNSTIRIKVVSHRADTVLSGDGQSLNKLANGDEVTIRRSRHAVRLVHLPGGSFFETLRAKLHWRGASV